MRLRVRGAGDVWSGLLVLAIGSVPLLFGRDYAMGTAARMGPGYFPVLVGGLLVALGLVILLRGLAFEGEPPGRFRLRPFLLVFGAMALFAALIDVIGFGLGAILLVVACAYADPDFRPREIALVAVGLTLFSYLLVATFLGMPFRLLPG